MRKLFSFFDYVMYIAGLNLLFLLCSLPIITMGTSLTALYAGLRAMVKKEPCFRTFFNTFRKSFLRSTLIWIILLAINAFFIDSFAFYLMHNRSAVIPLVASALFSTVFLCFTTMVFLFYSRFEGSVLQILQHSSSLFFSYPLRILLITALTWVPVMVAFLFPAIFFMLGVVWLFFYFAAVSTVAIWLVNRPFILFARDVLGMEVFSTPPADQEI